MVQSINDMLMVPEIPRNCTERPNSTCRNNIDTVARSCGKVVMLIIRNLGAGGGGHAVVRGCNTLHADGKPRLTTSRRVRLYSLFRCYRRAPRLQTFVQLSQALHIYTRPPQESAHNFKAIATPGNRDARLPSIARPPDLCQV
jgi:hypothetical protein